VNEGSSEKTNYGIKIMLSSRNQGLLIKSLISYMQYKIDFIFIVKLSCCLLSELATGAKSGKHALGTKCENMSPVRVSQVMIGFKTVALKSRSQRPRSFWLSTGIATSCQVQLRKSVIHGLPITLRMLRVKSDNSDCNLVLRAHVWSAPRHGAVE